MTTKLSQTEMNASRDTADALALLRKSNLYAEFQLERQEILKHKWLLSEQAGHDIGFETALTDWFIHHRSNWRRLRRQSHSPAH